MIIRVSTRLMLDTRLSGRKPELEPTRDVGMQEEGGGGWWQACYPRVFLFSLHRNNKMMAYRSTMT